MYKKVFSLVLALILSCASLFALTGTAYAASTGDDLESTIEKQIRAFADSIDKSNADDSAAAALASHGLTGRGKTLKVGKTHALTATLFNSELMPYTLADILAEAIRDMYDLGLSSLPYVYIGMVYDNANSRYQSQVYTAPTYGYESWDDLGWYLCELNNYTGKRNAYDSSLVWMVSGVNVHLQLERTKTTATEQTYQVNCKIYDRFDFATGSGSGFKDLLSGIGAAFFKEFDWESSVSFEIKVPYSCPHRFGNYHWVYNSDDGTMVSDSSDGYLPNNTANVLVGKNYNYELDEPVRLLHDRPWVIEYDIRNMETFHLAPVSGPTHALPYLVQNRSFYFFAGYHQHVKASQALIQEYGLNNKFQRITHYYGTPLASVYSYSSKTTYTLRLENVINVSGSNMLYLTVSNTATGEILLNQVPMDDYYNSNSWTSKTTFQQDGAQWVSGKDFYINYIDTHDDTFKSDIFDLRIWENGQGSETQSSFQTQITKPTCTKQGYTTYTCSHCGYSYTADKVKATGHTYGQWAVVTSATCTESGQEQRTCKTCKEVEKRTIPATGHNYENYVCTGCGDTLYAPGDVDTNGTIDVDDVLSLLWNVLFPEEYPIGVNADFDNNDTVDVDDVLTLLWHVLFPDEYPLN